MISTIGSRRLVLAGAVHDEDLLHHPELRRRQPDPRRLVHRRQHVLGERAHALVHRLDAGGGLAQPRVGMDQDRSDRHGREIGEAPRLGKAAPGSAAARNPCCGDEKLGVCSLGAHQGGQPMSFLAKYPQGLTTLFLVEMWERFSYYGMRAILVLFLVDQVQTGGLGLATAEAAAIYGLYTASVYILALPGGWIADRFWGCRRAILVGGCIIMLGHIVLAVSGTTAAIFYLGLACIAIGTGLLKPNISTMVGQLYDKNDIGGRDAGFSFFYMGINVGAILGGLIAGYLGEIWGWHWGFGAAAVAMFFGLLNFVFSSTLAGKGGVPAVAPPPRRRHRPPRPRLHRRHRRRRRGAHRHRRADRHASTSPPPRASPRRWA